MGGGGTVGGDGWRVWVVAGGGGRGGAGDRREWRDGVEGVGEDGSCGEGEMREVWGGWAAACKSQRGRGEQQVACKRTSSLLPCLLASATHQETNRHEGCHSNNPRWSP